MLVANNKTTMRSAEEEQEPLRKEVARAKSRWLRRVMYSTASSTEKSFAFVVFDHLNCVTLDAWPSQETIANLLHCSTKTVSRACEDLEAMGFLIVSRSTRRRLGHRYAPVFDRQDWDTDDLAFGQDCPENPDADVGQSSSVIHSKSTSVGGRRKKNSRYRSVERGKWETELARRLDPDGFDVLDRLASINDAIVENLCRALCDGELGQAEIEAARLAAEQSSGPWRRKG